MGAMTAPGRLRRTAITRPSTRTRSSAVRNSWTLTQNARVTRGHESAKTSGSKNDSWTRGQPGDEVMTAPIAPKRTAVETSAMRVPRLYSGAGRMRDRRPAWTGGIEPESAGPEPITPWRSWRVPPLGLELRGAVERQPLVGQGVERAVDGEGLDRLVHAARQPAVLLQDEAEVLGFGAGRRADLAEDLAAVDLDGGDEAGRRQVDDNSVDLAVLHRLEGVVRRVVDLRVDGRLDDVLDRGQAGRPDLGAQLGGLELGERRRLGEVAPLHDHDGLVAEVVALGQVGVFRALRVERDLADEEVEVLRARRERVVEGDRDPGDLVGREAQLLRDGVGRDRKSVV